MDNKDHKTNALLLAAALGVVLEQDEGVVVHHEGKGYIISLLHEEENNIWHVTVDCDDEILKYPHLQRIWLHDLPESEEVEEENYVEVDGHKETLQ